MASQKMDKLKQAGADMDKFFSGASEGVSEPSEEVRKTNPKTAKEKPSEGKKKAQKKVFSFRADVDLIDSWRVWADAKGLKMEELGTLAIQDYIKRHKLTEDQEKIYQLKLSQKS